MSNKLSTLAQKVQLSVHLGKKYDDPWKDFHISLEEILRLVIKESV